MLHATTTVDCSIGVVVIEFFWGLLNTTFNSIAGMLQRTLIFVYQSHVNFEDLLIGGIIRYSLSWHLSGMIWGVGRALHRG